MTSCGHDLGDEAIVVPELVDHSLREVLSSRDSSLGTAVARVVAEAADGTQHYAAHGSSPGPWPGQRT